MYLSEFVLCVKLIVFFVLQGRKLSEDDLSVRRSSTTAATSTATKTRPGLAAAESMSFDYK